MSEVWTKWEGQVVDGFPLRRVLGVSDHSGVFLTEAPAHNVSTAAVKLVPAIPTLAESQLAHWTAAAALSHPRLIRLFSTGRCQLGNLHCLYVVMEYAEQNLAHFLAQRALTDSEAREMLPATLGALAFLHSQNFVHGQLKPSNILVVGDQLKLASDTIRPAGEAATSISMVSVYDPPEGRDGSFSTAGDIWALGVTLFEALTRTLPAKPDDRSHGAALPPDFPPGCAVVVRECLSRRPGDRPTAASLQTWASGSLQPTPEFAPARPMEGPNTAARADIADRANVAGGAHPADRANAAGGANPAERANVAQSAAASAGGPIASVLPGAAPAGSAAAANSVRVPPSGPPSAAAAQQAGIAAPGVAAAAAGGLQPAGVGDPRGRLTIRAVVEREPLPEEVEPRRSFAPFVVGAVVVLIIAWLGMRFFGSHTPTVAGAPQGTTRPLTPDSASNPPSALNSTGGDTAATAPAAGAAPPTTPSESSPRNSHNSTAPRERHSGGASKHSPSVAPAPTASSGAVVHQELPKVSRNSLATIHGRVKVGVRVTVDSSGNVINDTLADPGPSHYFARVASQAARKWKFAPTGDKTARQWLIRFEFARSGVTAHAVERP